MSKKLIFFSIALILGISLISLLMVQAEAGWRNRQFCNWNCGGEGGFGPDDFGGPGEGMHLGQFLNLSTDQRQKMHKIRFEFSKKTIDLEEELGQKKLERRALLEKDPIDWKKVDQLTDEIAVVWGKMEKEKIRHHLEVKKILTPEQLEKFEDFRGGRGPEGPGNPMQPPQKGHGCGLGGTGRGMME